MKVFIEFSPEYDTYYLGGEADDGSGACFVPIDLYRPDHPERHIAGRTYIGAELAGIQTAHQRWAARGK